MNTTATAYSIKRSKGAFGNLPSFACTSTSSEPPEPMVSTLIYGPQPIRPLWISFLDETMERVGSALSTVPSLASNPPEIVRDLDFVDGLHAGRWSGRRLSIDFLLNGPGIAAVSGHTASRCFEQEIQAMHPGGYHGHYGHQNHTSLELRSKRKSISSTSTPVGYGSEAPTKRVRLQ